MYKSNVAYIDNRNKIT